MSSRLSKHSGFLFTCMSDCTIIETAQIPQINILVEIIYNILNNDKLFLTCSERDTLKPILPLLYDISSIRSPDLAGRQLRRLSQDHIEAIIIPALTACNLQL